MAHKNFDAVIAERQNRGHSFELGGITYLLPPSIPFDAVLRFADLSKRGKDAEVDQMEVIDIFKALVGEDNFTKLRANVQFDSELMLEIMNFILSIYASSENTSGPKGRRKTA